MIKLETITAGNPTQAQMCAFRQYASVADCSRDALLENLLREAMLAVGDWEDRSLLPLSLRLTIEDYDGTMLALYRGGGTITSVKDAEGHDLQYTGGPRCITIQAKGTVIIEYNTTPGVGDLARLMPRAYSYATARFDGEVDTLAQEKIKMGR